MTEPKKISENMIHLGLGATAEPQPPFTGMEWYEDYGKRVASDGAEGRLVSQYSFTEDWDAWEMHPNGAEVVLCTAGSIIISQEFPGGEIEKLTLGAGEYAINPPGVWHTADIATHATVLFITAGEGTQHRAR